MREKVTCFKLIGGNRDTACRIDINLPVLKNKRLPFEKNMIPNFLYIGSIYVVAFNWDAIRSISWATFSVFIMEISVATDNRPPFYKYPWSVHNNYNPYQVVVWRNFQSLYLN